MSESESPVIESSAPESQPSVEEPITSEESAELEAEAAAAEQAPVEPKRVKLKIDGEEMELTEEEVHKYASMGKAAQKRMQEASEVRKAHEKFQQDVSIFLETLKGDPARVLSDLGIDPNEFATEFLNKKIEEEQKSPEMKEKERLQKELEAAQKQIKEIEELKKREEQDRMSNEMASRIEKDITNALEKNDIPKHPHMLRKVADLMLLATSQKIELSAEDVIPLAKKQIIEEFRALTGVLPEELLEEILGTDKVASLRRRYLKKLKSVPESPKNILSTGESESKKSEKDAKPISAKDFFSKLGTF